MERKILAALMHSREAYDRLQHVLSSQSILSDQAAVLFEQMQVFYENDGNANAVDTEWLLSRLEREYPKHSDIFKRIVEGLEPVSVSNITDEFLALRKQRLSELLAEALLSSDDARVAELMEQWNTTAEATDIGDQGDVYEGVGVEELLTIFSPENMIPIYPQVLSDILGGGLPKGGHLFLFARPECGKTATAITIAAGAAHQGHKVQYFGNEDPPKLLLLRMVSRFTGWSIARIKADPQAASALAMERGYGNVRFVEMTPGTIPEMRRHILEYEPDMVVLDQLTNLNSKNQSRTEKYEELAYRFRMLCKELSVAGVSFGQAGESAEGKLQLAMDDVYFSNTGIAAQADAMIGIGMNEEYATLGRRMMTPCKNKLGGDHTPFNVTIDPVHSKVEGV